MADFWVNENSSFCLTVTLTGRDGNPLSPIDAVRWWVGRPKDTDPTYPIQTVVGPTAEIELVIPAEANICSRRRDEERFVVVQIESGVEHMKHEWFKYGVRAQDIVPYPT